MEENLTYCNLVSLTKEASRGEKLIYKFHEVTNQHATIFTNKNEHTPSYTNKNQHATSSMKKISFSKRKANVQVSQREKPTSK